MSKEEDKQEGRREEGGGGEQSKQVTPSKDVSSLQRGVCCAATCHVCKPWEGLLPGAYSTILSPPSPTPDELAGNDVRIWCRLIDWQVECRDRRCATNPKGSRCLCCLDFGLDTKRQMHLL